MKTTCDFLDDVKSRKCLPSDYALSKMLGVTAQSLSQYRNGRLILSDSMAIRVAELLEIDPAIVVTSAHAERSRQPEEKAIWEDIIKRLGGTAAALLLGLSLTATPAPAHASAGVTPSEYILCQQRKRRRVLC